MSIALNANPGFSLSLKKPEWIYSEKTSLSKTDFEVGK